MTHKMESLPSAMASLEKTSIRDDATRPNAMRLPHPRQLTATSQCKNLVTSNFCARRRRTTFAAGLKITQTALNIM